MHAAGDFATVLRRGDDVAGSVILVHHPRSGPDRALTRVVNRAGGFDWQVAASAESVGPWLQRQQGYDPDLWIVELDTPDPARFIDETIV